MFGIKIEIQMKHVPPPGLLTTADVTRINMYSKPPPLSIPPIVPPIPSYAITPRRYNAPGAPGRFMLCTANRIYGQIIWSMLSWSTGV